MQKDKRYKSIIWNLNSEQFQKLCQEKSSLAEILRHFDLRTGAGNYKTLKRRIKKENIDISHITLGVGSNKNRVFLHKRKTKDEALELFVENSKSATKEIKKYIQRFNLFDYRCQSCGLKDEWNGKEIVLQLDHINGINNDNRLENLRFLCPNCHSQTDTFSGRRFKKESKCIDCGKDNCKRHDRCQSCASKKTMNDKRKLLATKEELHDLIVVQKIPFTTIGKKFGVSDNAIRKRAMVLGIKW